MTDDAELVLAATGHTLADDVAARLCDGLRETIAASPEAAGRDPDELLVAVLVYLRPRGERPPARPGCAGVE